MLGVGFGPLWVIFDRTTQSYLPVDVSFAPKAAGAGASAALSNRVLERAQMVAVAGVAGLRQARLWLVLIDFVTMGALHERSKL
jgi:hypothetical protein